MNGNSAMLNSAIFFSLFLLFLVWLRSYWLRKAVSGSIRWIFGHIPHIIVGYLTISFVLGAPVGAATAAVVFAIAWALIKAKRDYDLIVSAKWFWQTYARFNGIRNRLARHYSKGFLLLLIDSLSVGIGAEAINTAAHIGKIAEGLLWGVPLIAIPIVHLYLVIFNKFKEGKMAFFNIMDIVDDPEKLERYFREEEDRNITIKIEPEKVIPLIKQEVIGQDHVVEEVINTLARRVRLKRNNKPLGVFMFVGATGSGKTELAKQVAKHVFNGRMARFDMNEFSSEHSVSRLIGSPPGYIDSEKGGQLTQEIKRLRSGVILFDEIEKCDKAVYNMIMTLLDEGRITEQSTGETMDATNFVIIMTSNAKQKEIVDLLQNTPDEVERRRAVRDTLQQVFRPEQLARIDEIFAFNKLGRRHIALIIGKFVYQFANDARVVLNKVDSDLLLHLLEQQTKIENYGVRELVRLIENKVVDGMLECRDAGYLKVNVSVNGDQISVTGVK